MTSLCYFKTDITDLLAGHYNDPIRRQYDLDRDW